MKLKILLMVLFQIAIISFFIFIGVKACEEVSQIGLKNIVHDIWEGADK